MLISENEILRAMKLLLIGERWVVEGAAGVVVAGFLKQRGKYAGNRVVLLLRAKHPC